jgi:hypothetical protein
MNIVRIAWRASKLIRCPICGADHSCSATVDDLHFCWHTHHDVPGWVHVGQCRNGFQMFYPAGGTNGRAPPPRSNGRANGRTAPAPREAPAVNCAAYLEGHRANARELRLLADALGVSYEALRRLRVGYVPQEAEDQSEHFLFPERDGAGRVVGLLRRYLSGHKRQVSGTRRGLVYDPDLVPDGLALVVEGASDVAAGLTAGLCVIGRPNNLGGVEDLARLLGDVARRGTEVIILGENDRKPGGAWPGREGAERAASELAGAWNLPVGWALPPEGVKDLREWLHRLKVSPGDPTACAEAGREIVGDCRTQGAGGRNKRPARCAEIPPYIRGGYGGGGDEGARNILGNLRAPAPKLTHFDFLGLSTRRVLAEGLTGVPCPRHYTPLLQGKSVPLKGLAIRADCQKYSCPPCAARRRCRWLTHLMALFDEHQGLHAWRGDSQGRTWKTVSARLSRQRADYVAFFGAAGAAPTLVLATRPVPGSEPVDVPAAAELAASSLLSLSGGSPRKPISTSRAWALHEDRDKGDYVRRGAAPRGGFPLVVSRLRREHLDPAVQNTSRGARCDWTFPADWPEERIELYFEGLGSPPRPGE